MMGPLSTNTYFTVMGMEEVDLKKVLKLNKCTYEEFIHEFEDAKKVSTDLIMEIHQGHDAQSITAYEVGDCIAVFAMEKNGEENVSIACYHIASKTKQSDMRDKFDEEAIDYKAKYEIVMIGGYEDFPALAVEIIDFIKKNFSNAVIVGQSYNLVDDSHHTFISVNMHIDGTLTYCEHSA